MEYLGYFYVKKYPSRIRSESIPCFRELLLRGDLNEAALCYYWSFVRSILQIRLQFKFLTSYTCLSCLLASLVGAQQASG